ncbi:MAG: DNA alkylation repair protein [Nitrospiraceae bacterium]|nr:DNA alkylation repair protein [Nitrospiraceae bacterium]
MLASLKSDLQHLADPEKARILSRFFKTGKGQYGEGDVFLGIVVPKQRAVAKKYLELPLSDIHRLLSSKIHEHRLVALLILVNKYKKTDQEGKGEIADFYLKHTKYINNWDLVDISAPNIPGDYLLDKDRSVLYRLARSGNIWERRISVLSTLAFIRENDFADTLRVSEILLRDDHDLIHKAVGWMLREVGKRDLQTEEDFLKKHYRRMPRTMLRYAIERFEEKKRRFFLDNDLYRYTY